MLRHAAGRPCLKLGVGSLLVRATRRASSSVFLRSMKPVGEGEQGGSERLRMMQYNVLAPEYAFGKYTEYCPRDALEWEYRSRLMLEEVAHYQPDLLTLQEVEDYDTNFAEQFRALGYEGLFKSTTNYSNKVGVAILYRTASLERAAELEIEFNDISNDYTWQKDNVGAALLLKAGDRHICVGTAHIYWDPRRAELKMMQSHHLCKELAKFVEDQPGLSLSDVPVLVGGDFNSKPSSEVYKYLADGFIDRPEGCLYTPRLEHRLQLSSAYASMNEPASNFTMDFQGCLDYIWHSPHFQVRELLEPVSAVDAELFSEIRFLPNRLLPSDHTALVADLSL